MKMKIIFYLYTMLLVFLILFKFSFTINDIKQTIEQFRSVDYQKVNFVFLKTIKTQIKLLDNWSILNLFGNSIPFIVYGILFYFSFSKNVIRFIIVNITFILSLELLQLIFDIGTFDVDDIFLNCISIFFGYFFVNIISKIFSFKK